MNIVKRHQRPLLPALYAATLMFLCLTLWNPGIKIGAGSIDLMLVLDESDSVSPDHNNALWKNFIQICQSLPAGSRFSLLRFADQVSVEIPWTSIQHSDFKKYQHSQQPPRHRYLDTSATNLQAAVQLALSQSSQQQQTAIVISSDGLENIVAQQHSPAVSIKKSNVSLFYTPAEPAAGGTNATIDSINIARYINPGQPVAVSLALGSTTDTQVILQIKDNNNLVQHTIALRPGNPNVLNINLPAFTSGPQSLQFMLLDQQHNILDKQIRLVDIANHRKLLLIGNSMTGVSPEPDLLQGWESTKLQPHQLLSSNIIFENYAVIILDDVSADALDSATIRQLRRAIQQSASGLIVTGGQHSFGSGGYRHSLLEQLLPVTAQASRPVSAAAVLFLLDKSGSMEASGTSHSRLADAFKAVSETAKSIRAGDESAVLAFDRDVQTLLPLKQRADLAAELNQPWQLMPSGGTRLIPALSKAVTMLATSDSQQRFLILVSDGFVETENLQPLTAALQESNIVLIALAIGDDADLSTLQQLTRANGGQLLQIKDSAQLPRFMRQQLDKKLPSWSEQSVTPQMTLRPPFIKHDVTQWKTMQGYQITRAKPDATVYISTPQGDPLLVSHQSGAGRVVALPGGLLQTTDSDQLLAHLVNWLNSRQGHLNLQVSHHYESAQLTLLVDAITAGNNWQTDTPAQLLLTANNTTMQSTPLEMIAPGRFKAVVDVPVSGLYQATISIGQQRTVYSAYLSLDREKYAHAIASWLTQALNSGDIQYWDAAAVKHILSTTSAQHKIRSLWLVLALFSLLLLILVERKPALIWLKATYFQPESVTS